MHLITLFQPSAIGCIGGKFAVHVRRYGKLLSSITGIETHSMAERMAREKRDWFGPQYQIVDETKGESPAVIEAEDSAYGGDRRIMYGIFEDEVQSVALRIHGRELSQQELTSVANGIQSGLGEGRDDILQTAVSEVVERACTMLITFSIRSQSGWSSPTFVITDSRGQRSEGRIHKGSEEGIEIVWQAEPQVAGYGDIAQLEDIVVNRYMQEVEGLSIDSMVESARG